MGLSGDPHKRRKRKGPLGNNQEGLTKLSTWKAGGGGILPGMWDESATRVAIENRSQSVRELQKEYDALSPLSEQAEDRLKMIESLNKEIGQLLEHREALQAGIFTTLV
jgi:hypothetical protein